MASNRAQRRAAKHSGKRPGETYADVLTKKKMIKEAVEQSVHDHSIAIEADIKTQRFLWMAVIALNEAFGFGGERARRFLEALMKVADEVEQLAKKNGGYYARKKMMDRASQITGIDITPVHEEEMRQARLQNEANGIFFPAEDPDALAGIGFTGARDTGPKWIPVTEKLPERGQWVLVYRGRFISPDVISHRFWETCHNTWRLTTHWMPFPEFPKELADDVARSLLQEKIADAED